MNLVVDVFTQWRNPAIKTQRKWVLAQMNGELATKPNSLIFGFIAISLFSLLLNGSGGEILKPTVYFVWAINLHMVGMGFAIFAVLPRCRQFRSGLATVAMLQAALLWLALGSLLMGAISFFVKDWVPVFLMLNVGLLGWCLALYIPSRFTKLRSREGAASYLMLASIGAAILLSQISFSLWYFVLSVFLVAAIVYKLPTWARPVPAFIFVKSEIKPQPIQLPIVSKWQVNLQQYFGEKLNLVFWLKTLFSWSCVCVLVVQGVQWFDFSATASDLYSALYVGLVLGGTQSLLSERKIWPYLWLRQIRSRQALWQHSEMRFWIGHLCLVILMGVLILLGDLDQPSNIVHAAIFTIASLTLVRYANLAFPWFSWGKGKTEVGNPVLSYVLLIALWVVMRGLWRDEDYFLIAVTSAALLLAALMIRRRAKQYILQFDLGALRRNQSI